MCAHFRCVLHIVRHNVHTMTHSALARSIASIDIKVYSQIKFCRNSTLYPWANNLAETLLFIAVVLPLIRRVYACMSKNGIKYMKTIFAYVHKLHICGTRSTAPSFESNITIRTNNKNWCYMIFCASVRLLFSHYCLLLFNFEGGSVCRVRMKWNISQNKNSKDMLSHRKRITYAEIFRKGLSHKTYNILPITSKAA